MVVSTIELPPTCVQPMSMHGSGCVSDPGSPPLGLKRSGPGTRAAALDAAQLMFVGLLKPILWVDQIHKTHHRSESLA